MTLPIGILQGRLSPSEDGRFQFSPREWEAEFMIARELGFTSLEWLFDFTCFTENAMFTVSGREAIGIVAQKAGVPVSSICADYYMKYRFTGADAKRSVEILRMLIDSAETTSEKLILIPLLEGNAPKSGAEKEEIVSHIRNVLPTLMARNVRIGFETEMPRAELSAFLDSFSSDAVGVYYDIGNATSYGFDVPGDIRFFGKRIFGVHAKDRKKGSAQSVLLGTGDAPYKETLRALQEIHFGGTIIMQAWRGEEYLSDAKKQLSLLTALI
ncbi:MAG: sugar phosphate isomerase/epimerase [Candidatus Taylorbacteria bacterium]|nr:sugar phosphate isomerase/epimerase [Candidatus Taylorbacteria bacterium]